MPSLGKSIFSKKYKSSCFQLPSFSGPLYWYRLFQVEENQAFPRLLTLQTQVDTKLSYKLNYLFKSVVFINPLALRSTVTLTQAGFWVSTKELLGNHCSSRRKKKKKKDRKPGFQILIWAQLLITHCQSTNSIWFNIHLSNSCICQDSAKY